MERADMIKSEKTVLKVSVYAAILFSITGIGVGIMADSQMILFDGLYSIMSFALSGLSLFTSYFKSKEDEARYPFGKERIEPIVIVVKYSAILIMVIGSLIAAIYALFTGGREVSLNLAILYSIGGATLCYLVYRYLYFHPAREVSNLISAEANQWFMDTLVTVGVVVGFIITYLVKRMGWATGLIPYIDPLMVIAVSIYFIRVPVLEIKNSIGELMDMRPEGNISSKIESDVSDIEKKYGIKESFVRISKTSNMVWIEVDFLVDSSSQVKTVENQDTVREEFRRRMESISYEKWITISFIGDRKWAI